MNKVSKSLKEKFRELASMLPPMWELDGQGKIKTEIRSIPGTTFLEAGKTRTISGSVVNKNRFYSTRVNVAVDHLKNIIQTYEKFGENGVNSYVNAITAKAKEKTPKVVEPQGLVLTK